MSFSLRFEKAADGCCNICNPVKLADLETDCVHVVGSHGGHTIEICFDCIFKMVLAQEGQTVDKPVHSDVVDMILARVNRVVVQMECDVCRGEGMRGNEICGGCQGAGTVHQ